MKNLFLASALLMSLSASAQTDNLYTGFYGDRDALRVSMNYRAKPQQVTAALEECAGDAKSKISLSRQESPSVTHLVTDWIAFDSEAKTSDDNARYMLAIYVQAKNTHDDGYTAVHTEILGQRRDGAGAEWRDWANMDKESPAMALDAEQSLLRCVRSKIADQPNN